MLVHRADRQRRIDVFDVGIAQQNHGTHLFDGIDAQLADRFEAGGIELKRQSVVAARLGDLRRIGVSYNFV